MKSELTYTLKVCVIALVLSFPVTFGIGWAYIALVLLTKPTNYNFNFNLTLNHLIIFIVITAGITYASKSSLAKIGNKRYVNDRPIAYSIMIFLVYLLLAGILLTMKVDQFIFSYCPMFLITYLCSKIFLVNKPEIVL
jgi:hypothetical protein